jgi:hypothetical protein
MLNNSFGKLNSSVKIASVEHKDISPKAGGRARATNGAFESGEKMGKVDLMN